MHTVQLKNIWTRRFQCGPCGVKESTRLVALRTYCFIVRTTGTLQMPFVCQMQTFLMQVLHRVTRVNGFIMFCRSFYDLSEPSVHTFEL
jgi:hypothetical protein